EDGIRGFHVTGVQTCALPIFEITKHGKRVALLDNFTDPVGGGNPDAVTENFHHVANINYKSIRHWRCVYPLTCAVLYFKAGGGRSEERRVGKECRSMMSATEW